MTNTIPFSIIFSERYRRSIEKNLLAVEIPPDVRLRLASKCIQYNFHFLYSPPDNPNFNIDKYSFEEILLELKTQKGWLFSDKKPMWLEDSYDQDTIVECIKLAPGENVLDIIELIHESLNLPEQKEFKNYINFLMKNFGISWRISEGQFIKLDNFFINEQILPIALEKVAAGKYLTVFEELNKSVNFLNIEEYRQSIHMAACSIESMLKIMTGETQKTMNGLIQSLANLGYLEDLPSTKNIMMSHVLLVVANIRNKHAGHGHGLKIEETPRAYAELSINLASSLIIFLLDKHLEKNPQEYILENKSGLDNNLDEIPF